MARYWSVKWKDGLSVELGKAPAKVRRAAILAAQSMAPEVENYMKLNAPWKDQTSNARNGLAARAYQDGTDIGIVLFHQVSYGVFLETRWGGRYSIINPTIEVMAPRVMMRFDRIMDRI
ncbi:hypothetical protein SEA_WOLLYPOG_10 [Arthrobacter phage Wollypog]|uniref:Uncharacterized protein n=1 Tax=Arthrobacter phage Wollypog TaxID=2790985 RepID=A0A7T3N3D2_9CAUD|nr:hypothetical protein PP291_gp10 [Arthrobacter phage Wollypog]QPX62563.1 hypothetical protein SEA_WOLLYPOG_10 [Arthrobacter phage Wollypog]